MKLRELLAPYHPSIEEAICNKKPMNIATKRALPHLNSYEYLDNNNHPYMAYRFGIALAGSPDNTMYPRGTIGSDFTISSFSDGDEAIRKAAEKFMGVNSINHTSAKSKELKDTNTNSPIHQSKRNRYGV